MIASRTAQTKKRRTSLVKVRKRRTLHWRRRTPKSPATAAFRPASGPLCANDDAFPRPICRAIDRAAGRRAADSDEMAYLMTVASIEPDENPGRTKTL
jgi:hypothetical protein